MPVRARHAPEPRTAEVVSLAGAELTVRVRRPPHVEKPRDTVRVGDTLLVDSDFETVAAELVRGDRTGLLVLRLRAPLESETKVVLLRPGLGGLRSTSEAP